MRSLFSRPRAAELAAVNLYSDRAEVGHIRRNGSERPVVDVCAQFLLAGDPVETLQRMRSEEHTSELQSHSDLVCRLLLEKKNIVIRRRGVWVPATRSQRRTTRHVSSSKS